MKSLFCWLTLIIVGFEVLQSNGQETSLAIGIDRRTGQLIGTDLVCKQKYDAMTEDAGRMIDGDGPWHNYGVYSLGAAIELQTNRESLEGWIIIGVYRMISDQITPADRISKLWVEVADNDNLEFGDYDNYLGGTYFGHDNVWYEPEPVLSPRSLKIDVLAKERIRHRGMEDEMLYILKIYFPVLLNKRIDHIPSIGIRGRLQGFDFGWKFHRSQNRTTAADIESQIRNSSITAGKNSATANKSKNPAVFGTQPTVADKSTVLPGITLSISKKDGFLLVTFSPVVTNANLEQANVSSYPWVWQNAITTTNSATNGWYVTPTLEPRVFRVRIDR